MGGIEAILAAMQTHLKVASVIEQVIFCVLPLTFRAVQHWLLFVFGTNPTADWWWRLLERAWW